LARLDREKYKNIYTSGTDQHPYLTNSTQLNVDATRDIFEALKHPSRYPAPYTGGTIFHAFYLKPLTGRPADCLVQKIAETRLPYFSITPTFSVCENHGYIRGEQRVCPRVWARNRSLFEDCWLPAADSYLE